MNPHTSLLYGDFFTKAVNPIFKQEEPEINPALLIFERKIEPRPSAWEAPAEDELNFRFTITSD